MLSVRKTISLTAGFRVGDAVSSDHVPPKMKQLIATLVLLGRKGVGRNRLCELLWPESPPQQARASLRQGLSWLRKLFNGSAIQIEVNGNQVAIRGPSEAVDLWEIEDSLSSDPFDPDRAMAIYNRDLFADLELGGELREVLHAERLGLHKKIVEQLSFDEPSLAPEQVAEFARRVLTIDPSEERAHRALIRLHLADGDTAAAQAQLQECRRVLRASFNASPSPQTLELFLEAADPGAGHRADASASVGNAADAALESIERLPSIVVLPFDFFGSGDEAPLSEILCEEITNEMSRFSDFFVISRRSGKVAAERFSSISEIGRELGADMVLEGSIRRHNGMLKVGASLTDTAKEHKKWSQTYQEPFDQSMKAIDRIVAKIAGSVWNPVYLSQQSEVSLRRSPKLAAYSKVVRGLNKLVTLSPAETDEAIRHFHAAKLLDPESARASGLYAWALCRRVMYCWGDVTPELRSECERNANKAVQLSGNDPLALLAASVAYSFLGCSQSHVGELLDRSLELNPNNSWTWMRKGWHFNHIGDGARGAAAFERSRDLSPFDPFLSATLLGWAMSLTMLGDYKAALAIRLSGARHAPEAEWGGHNLAGLYYLNGEMDLARETMRRAVERFPEFTLEEFRRKRPAAYVRQLEPLMKAFKELGMP
ncbi:MAG: BTAD domain-containing putative transcriptional regulator [Pseudomonadota bacterium]